MKKFAAMFVIVAFALTACQSVAQAKASASPAVSQQATVVSVTGAASYRDLARKPSKWQGLKVGDKLGQLCLVRTGFGSTVALEFADRGRWIVKPSSKFGIREYSRQGKHVRARLGLKYGYVNGNIDSSRGTNDFRVKTPVATLAATGTGAYIGYSGDRGMGAYGTHGSWKMGTKRGQRRLTWGQRTDGGRTLSSFILGQSLAPGLGARGRTGVELVHINTNTGGRGLIVMGNNKGKLIAPPKPPCGKVPIPNPNYGGDTSP